MNKKPTFSLALPIDAEPMNRDILLSPIAGTFFVALVDDCAVPVEIRYDSDTKVGVVGWRDQSTAERFECAQSLPDLVEDFLVTEGVSSADRSGGVERCSGRRGGQGSPTWTSRTSQLHG